MRADLGALGASVARWSVAALSLVALAAGFTTAPVASAEAPVEVSSCTVLPELAPGDRGDEVRCLQFALILSGHRLGYTGEFDATTAEAVREYQRSHPPLSVDGRAGSDTLASLGLLPARGALPVCTADAEITPGERGMSVACLQRRLTELGFYSGSISGLYDGPTGDALRRFQAANPPLRVDGVGGPKTLLTLAIWSGATSDDGRFTGPGPFPASLQPEPAWVLTAEGIPAYAGRSACSPDEAAVIAAEFAVDGADVLTQQWAVYVASRESGCRFDAVTLNMRTRDDSQCAFQLNVLSGTFAPTGELGRRGWTPALVRSSLQACADAASDLWVRCGRGPWIKPYSCRPPWIGSVDGQVPPVLPVEGAPGPSVPEPTVPEPAGPPDPAPPPEAQSTPTTVGGPPAPAD